MMTDTADYLARLDEALRDVPHGVASDIRAGIAEELQGLPPAAASERIAQLGDPESIAREALAADAGSGTRRDPDPGALGRPEATAPTAERRGFAVTAALVLAFGGFIPPFVLGWVVGAVLVAMSALWRSWEKVVAIAIPIAAFATILLVSLPAYVVGSTRVEETTGTGGAPLAEAANPLVPTWYDVIWIVVPVVAYVAIPASGLWLLWRLRGRTAPVA